MRFSCLPSPAMKGMVSSTRPLPWPGSRVLGVMTKPSRSSGVTRLQHRRALGCQNLADTNVDLAGHERRDESPQAFPLDHGLIDGGSEFVTVHLGPPSRASVAVSWARQRWLGGDLPRRISACQATGTVVRLWRQTDQVSRQRSQQTIDQLDTVRAKDHDCTAHISSGADGNEGAVRATYAPVQFPGVR